MKGSTFKRCTVCDRVVKGKRCTNCTSTSVSWGFIVDIGKDAAGKRRQRRRTGFATERDADKALQELLASLGDGTAVAPSTITVAEYLTGQWLPAVQPPNLRETTWIEYERMTRLHVAPRIGGVPLQDLNPSHLNRMYAELLGNGRADGEGGLSVKSVRNIHLMLGKALGDAVRWGTAQAQRRAPYRPAAGPRRGRRPSRAHPGLGGRAARHLPRPRPRRPPVRAVGRAGDDRDAPW